jgi:hypothetical protein
MRSIIRRQSKFDWSKYFDLPPETRKERLLNECRRNDVSIHIDGPTETSSGINSILRPVASEAELERRLVAKLAIGKSAWANKIAGLSLLVSLISLAVSIWGK